MGGILDIFGASKTAKAQKQAADKSAAASQYATDQSMALQREQFNRIWEATAPSRKPVSYTHLTLPTKRIV